MTTTLVTLLVVLGLFGVFIIIKIAFSVQYGKVSKNYIKNTKPGDEVRIPMGNGIYKPAKVIENNGDNFKLEIIVDKRWVSASEPVYDRWVSKKGIIKYLFNIG